MSMKLRGRCRIQSWTKIQPSSFLTSYRICTKSNLKFWRKQIKTVSIFRDRILCFVVFAEQRVRFVLNRSACTGGQTHIITPELLPSIRNYLLISWPTLTRGYSYRFPVMKTTIMLESLDSLSSSCCSCPCLLMAVSFKHVVKIKMNHFWCLHVEFLKKLLSNIYIFFYLACSSTGLGSLLSHSQVIEPESVIIFTTHHNVFLSPKFAPSWCFSGRSCAMPEIL